MEISSAQVTRIFSSYKSQARIAELNKKANIKSVQGQVDRVDISKKARELIALQSNPKAVTTKTEPAAPSEPREKADEIPG